MRELWKEAAVPDADAERLRADRTDLFPPTGKSFVTFPIHIPRGDWAAKASWPVAGSPKTEGAE